MATSLNSLWSLTIDMGYGKDSLEEEVTYFYTILAGKSIARPKVNKAHKANDASSDFMLEGMIA